MWSHFLILGLAFCTILLFPSDKSKPDWIDYTKRQKQYPKEIYLIGFVSETATKEQVSASNDKLISLSKLTLLQSIKVDLKTESELNLANVNREGQTRSVEEFFQNSYAKAQATIVGIQVETFYDKKAKVNYAFAYAKISAVTKYYQQLAQNASKEIEPYFESYEQNKNLSKIEALQNLEQIRTKLEIIKTAQSILEALDKPMTTLDSTDAYNRRLKAAFNQLLNDKNLKLNELAYFLAYGLSLQNIKKTSSLFIANLTYADTQLESPFVAVFAAAFKNELLKFNYILKDKSESSHYIKSVLRMEDGFVQFRISVLDEKQKSIVAGNYNYLGKKWLEDNQVEYIPSAFSKAQALKNLTFEHSIKTKKGASDWFKIQDVILKAKIGQTPIGQLPLILKSSDKGILKSASTDQQGIAQFSLKSEIQKQGFSVSVELPKFLNLPENHYFITTLKKPTYNFYLNPTLVKVYVESEEKNLGELLTINFLEPQIKQILSKKGYEFSNENDCDLKIKIQAETRSGAAPYGIYLSYIDATISVMSTASSRELYKQKFSTIKGAGQNFEMAGMKAFKTLAKKMKKELERAMKSK